MIPAPDPRALPRLVHVVHSLEVGGLERVVLDLAQRARREGADHRILSFDAPDAGRRQLDPGDVPCAFLPRGGGVDLRFARRVRTFLEQSGATIVHAHNDTPICYAALAGLTRTRATPSLVGTFHTLPSHGGRAARALTKWSTGRADALTVVASDLGERLQKAGWSQPMQVIPNGVQLDLFRARGQGDARRPWRQQAGIPAEAFLVGCFARFVPGKRHDDLIEAVRILRRAGTRVFLLLAGQGPLQGALREGLRNDPDARVLDPIDDVASALRDLDALVLCSEHEAHPRIVLEAMATGIACVLTDVGGMPEMARTSAGGRGALLVPARDPRSLAAALQSLASDDGLRATIGAAGRECAERFSFETQWAAYCDLWDDVIRRRGAG